MSAADSQSSRLERRSLTCANCAAPLADDQRYCLNCGTRRGPVPGAVAGLITSLTGEARDGQATPAPADAWFTWPDLSGITPRIAAVSVMAMLAFGVVVGSGATSLANSGGRSLLLALSRPGVAATPTVAANAGGGFGGGGGGGGGSSSGPVVVTQTIAAQTVTAGGGGGGGGGGGTATPAPPGPTLPPIKHVFEIVLSGQGYNQAYGPNSPFPYLAGTLRKQGELLQNYYAVAPSPLSNALALVSGQGPNPQTASDCPQYTAFQQTGTGSEQQALGSGCVFPAKTQTLGDQLTAAGMSWKAYVEGMRAAAMANATSSSGTTSTATTTGATTTGGATTPAASSTTTTASTSSSAPGSTSAAAAGGSCQHPPLGAQDPNSSPSAASPYVTWRNPFVYFQSLSAACPSQDVDLSQLATDLKSESSTPTVSYIVPGQCDDGSEQACVPGQPANPQAADAATESFLRSVVPAIEHSPAYKAGGLILITFDNAPQSGPNADHSACCQTPPYPNMPSSSSASSSSSSTTTSTTSAAATGTAPGVTSTPAGTGSSSSTTSAGTPTTSSTTTPPGSTSSTTTSSTTSAPVGNGETVPTGGGGQVGLLLISQYVKPNSLDPNDYYNHYSVLASIESLFSLSRLGFASDLSLPVFDRVIYNAWTG